MACLPTDCKNEKLSNVISKLMTLKPHETVDLVLTELKGIAVAPSSNIAPKNEEAFEKIQELLISFEEKAERYLKNIYQ